MKERFAPEQEEGSLCLFNMNSLNIPFAMFMNVAGDYFPPQESPLS